jgi:hypothetical protein
MDYWRRFFKEEYFVNLIWQNVLSIYPQRQDWNSIQGGPCAKSPWGNRSFFIRMCLYFLCSCFPFGQVNTFFSIKKSISGYGVKPLRKKIFNYRKAKNKYPEICPLLQKLLVSNFSVAFSRTKLRANFLWVKKWDGFGRQAQNSIMTFWVSTNCLKLKTNYPIYFIKPPLCWLTAAMQTSWPWLCKAHSNQNPLQNENHHLFDCTLIDCN